MYGEQSVDPVIGYWRVNCPGNPCLWETVTGFSRRQGRFCFGHALSTLKKEFTQEIPRCICSVALKMLKLSVGGKELRIV